MTWGSWKWPDELTGGTWLLIAAVFSVTLIIAQHLGFHGYAERSAKLLLAASLMLVLAGSAYVRRFPMAATIAAVFAWKLTVVATMPLGNYVLSGLNLPLADTGLQRIDLVFGLDTVRATQWLGRYEHISQGAAFAYHHVIFLMYFGVAVLILRGDTARLRDTMTLTTVTLIVTNVLAGLVPAIGPFPLHGSIESVAGYLSGSLPTTYVPHFSGVRDGTLRFLGPGHTWDGLTTFPSYHTAFALCAGYALANTRYLAWPSMIFAGSVILATFPVGGHYAIDIAAGGAIFAGVLASIRRKPRVRAKQAAVHGAVVAGGLLPGAP